MRKPLKGQELKDAIDDFTSHIHRAKARLLRIKRV